MSERNFQFTVLRAKPDDVRNEVLNAGIVVFNGQDTVVRFGDAARLSALHPDYGRLNISSWAEQIQDSLRQSTEEGQLMMLSLLAAPFVPDSVLGSILHTSAAEAAQLLFDRLVAKQPARLARPKVQTIRQTKLTKEIKDWLKGAKAFSTRVEDLSKHLVVQNYPIDPAADLYADFALMNGKLHVIETLDLRNVDHLTPTVRGDAAIKGVTLSEASEQANTIAIISATDYQVARPAIKMMSRFANDLYDLGTSQDKQRLAEFMARSLHKPDLTNYLN